MNEEPLIGLLLLQLVFILLNAVFAGAEIAVITFNDKKLKKLAHGGDKRAIVFCKYFLQKVASKKYRVLHSGKSIVLQAEMQS
ncbi:MAG: magnesium and cobalt exporter, family, partial [Eubacteriaceae bacterium]|nr:magnesium and cobalt exporter, family [Eubacteriaceae bacterium]MDK2936986.1 magnesium and cobalt exporter, family [Eubacteriaceae bacterium]MDK2960926.1 magnesium and cobalt exporter, family [Eubacteriaceae bacterium]MDN5306879.1 magnesium and cobalt exporter, family [Eubacteriaceae bacterium]